MPEPIIKVKNPFYARRKRKEEAEAQRKLTEEQRAKDAAAKARERLERRYGGSDWFSKTSSITINGKPYGMGTPEDREAARKALADAKKALDDAKRAMKMDKVFEDLKATLDDIKKDIK